MSRLLILMFLFSVGCGEAFTPTSNQRAHELEYCGLAEDDAGCQAMGCEVALSGMTGHVKDGACMIAQAEVSAVCFINRGTQPVMEWGNSIERYARQRKDGSYDVIQLGGVYDEALLDWRNCSGSQLPCNACAFP